MPMKTLTAFLDFFKSVPLFEGMTVEQIQTIINVMKLKQVDAGQRITEEGANEDSVFILMDGEVEISKRLTLALWGNDSEQQAKSLIRLTGDDHAFFGEMALFQEIPERSASIASLKPCKLAVLVQPALTRLRHQTGAQEEEPRDVLYRPAERPARNRPVSPMRAHETALS